MDDAIWQPFRIPAQGLAVEFPGEPVGRRAVIRTGGGPTTIHGYEVEHAGVTYMAAHVRPPAGITITEWVALYDAPLDCWVVGGKRRRDLARRAPTQQDLTDWTEDFGLRTRADGVPRIARKRRVERHGRLYQALAVFPVAADGAPVVDRFLRSLDPTPIAADRRGLTAAWRRRVAREDQGYSILWPDRLDDPRLRVVPVPSGSVTALGHFAFEPPVGYAVVVEDYYPPFPRARVGLHLGPGSILADVRDRLLASLGARLVAERPIAQDARPGIEFEADLVAPTPADASTRQLPGPGVAHLRARAFAGPHRAWLVVATLPDFGPRRGPATFLDSFRPIEPPPESSGPADLSARIDDLLRPPG